MPTNNSWNSPYPTNKGDMIVGDGTFDPSILSVGTDGYLLTADSAQSVGMKWANYGIPQYPLYYTSGTVTNAQIKSMFTTPVTLISAPGSGKMLMILFIVAKFIYGGTNVFTGGGTVGFMYQGSSIVSSFTQLTSGIMTGSTSTYAFMGSGFSNAITVSSTQNKALQIGNLTGAFTGNAANNNTIDYFINYTIFDI
jgi:hypothetical protein